VDHDSLIRIVERRVMDNGVMWLVRIVLENYDSGIPGKGMPLGNWTSQFFANVYLNELDQFVKHNLKVRYYLRYVDDFVIVHQSWSQLEEYLNDIRRFLDIIQLELHPTKCSIQPLSRGVSFLGFRVYPHYRIPRKRNLRKIQIKITDLLDSYGLGQSDSTDILETLNGWIGYAMQGDTYHLRKHIIKSVHSELEKRTYLRKTTRHT
ncbi:RNA-directed DNA polymerase, partial [Candidatus Woesearchaeota archaeon]|nr:RNA-directed DNA polymerase [Candidatus Woesearchaeota archaeon]